MNQKDIETAVNTELLYGRLKSVQRRAYEQASAGKGKERHATAGEAFEDQQICEISRRLKGHAAGGPLFQVVKKSYESGRLPKQRAIAELLGAMNYLAAAIIIMDELPEEEKSTSAKCEEK